MLFVNQKITVWNKYRGPNPQSNDIFYRHILPALCKYRKKIIRSATADGVYIACSQQVTIPYSEKFRSPNEWISLSDNERKEFFTLQDGDLVALGEITLEITGNTGEREADIRNKLKPEVFTIKAIKDCSRYALIKHWVIEGT